MQKVLKLKELPRKGTTTNRRSAQMLTTFCVFHLTEFSLPLILHFQIRGTCKRQPDRVENDGKVQAHTGNSPVLSEKIAREVSAPRPYVAEHLL